MCKIPRTKTLKKYPKRSKEILAKIPRFKWRQSCMAPPWDFTAEKRKYLKQNKRRFWIRWREFDCTKLKSRFFHDCNVWKVHFSGLMRSAKARWKFMIDFQKHLNLNFDTADTVCGQISNWESAFSSTPRTDTRHEVISGKWIVKRRNWIIHENGKFYDRLDWNANTQKIRETPTGSMTIESW